MALTKIGVSSINNTFKTAISGSTRGEFSSSVHLRQVATTISGSLGANASVIRTLDRTTISGSTTSLSSSVAADVAANLVSITNNSSSVASDVASNLSTINTLKGSGTIQGVGQGNSPTFAAGTITGNFDVGGTLTAQEVHTEFESASILFTSGSTRFGDDTTDTHRVTGSMDISGSLKIPHGDLIIQDNIDVEGDIDINGTTNLDVVDIDGAVTQDG